MRCVPCAKQGAIKDKRCADIRHDIRHHIINYTWRIILSHILPVYSTDRKDTWPAYNCFLKLISSTNLRRYQVIWGPVNIPDHSVETDIDPYEYIYGKFCYKRADMNNLYRKFQNQTVFRGVDRLKLLYTIMTARSYEGGCNLDIYKMIKDKCLLGFYPLHDHVELLVLEAKWLQFCQFPWNQPVDDIKDYFGEKIGLYFVWLGHYTTWLAGSAVVGFFCWINVAADDNNPNAVIMPYFATFMAFWATFFLEFWKRKESTTAMKWGTTGFEQEEQSRPQFIGERKPSPVTGQEYLYFPYMQKARRLMHSFLVITFFIIIVVVAVGSVFVLRLILTRMSVMTQGGIAFGPIVAAIANAVVIQVMNMIYGSVAIALTNFENHSKLTLFVEFICFEYYFKLNMNLPILSFTGTDTMYEDNLIAKTFVFQFVNSYAPLMYIAFVKPFIQSLDPCLGSCMGELQTQLGTIFITQLLVGNITEVRLIVFLKCSYSPTIL
jgi:hypothetical protein